MRTRPLMSDQQTYSVHSKGGMDLQSLIKALRHTNLGIRWRAALALGEIGMKYPTVDWGECKK